jgi:dUTP pyrophosphatase
MAQDNDPKTPNAPATASPSTHPPQRDSSDGRPILRVVRLRSARGDADKGLRSSSDLYRAPRRSNPDDAGLDLEAAHHEMVYPDIPTRVPHNLAVAIPEGFYGLIVPRSSTLHEKGLIVIPGVIDPGYRGELMTVVYNPRKSTTQIVAGERLSQLLLIPFIPANVKEVKSLPESDTRGDKGFGSTGGFVGKT